MLRDLACAALAAGALAAGGLAGAHQGEDDHEEAAGRMLDCGRLPAEAAISVAQPVAQWARIVCRETGQLLVPSPGWQWRYPASFTTPVIVSATAASPDAAGARYFTAVDVAASDGAAAARLHSELSRDVAVYALNAGADAPDAAYTLVASNDLGDELRIHFVPRGAGGFLGVVCASSCIPESTFIVHRTGG
jgi:hypothetical protein